MFIPLTRGLLHTMSIFQPLDVSSGRLKFQQGFDTKETIEVRIHVGKVITDVYSW